MEKEITCNDKNLRKIKGTAETAKNFSLMSTSKTI